MNDLISRQAAINMFLNEGMPTAAVYIERMSSAQPEEINRKDRGSRQMKVKELIPITQQQHGHLTPIIIYDLYSDLDLTITYSLESPACKPWLDYNIKRIQGCKDGLVITIDK